MKRHPGIRRRYYLRHVAKAPRRFLAKRRSYYAKNADKWKIYYLANKKRLLAAMALRSRLPRNKPRRRNSRRNHYARKRGACGSHTAVQVAELVRKQQHRCANPHCRASIRRGRYVADHKIPIERGGSNYIRNIQLLCNACNMHKGARTPREWARAGMRLAA